jgi:nucleoside-diphosphate-sugar epimerase
MKFLITGATGFIGQHFCHALLAHGHNVVALVRNKKKAASLPQDRLTVLEGDLAKFCAPGFIIPACDIVVHLAGTITAKKTSDYALNNFEAVKDLVACLSRQNWRPKRLLFASSLAASGPSQNQKPLTESDTPHPVDDYGRAKLNAENFLLAQNDFPVTLFRPAAVIGPLDTNWLNAYKIARSGFGFVPSGPKQKISFIAVSDLVDAMLRFCQDSSQTHRKYFIAHDAPMDNHEIWHGIAKSLGKKIRLISLPRPFLYTAMLANTFAANLLGTNSVFDRKYYEQMRADSWLCSSEKLKYDFSWQAKKSLELVLSETAESYKNNGWL